MRRSANWATKAVAESGVMSSSIYSMWIYTAKRPNRPRENSQEAGRTSLAGNTFVTLLIIEMIMNGIFSKINDAFHNYLSLYIGDNVNNTTFVGSYCLFVAIVYLWPLFVTLVSP